MKLSYIINGIILYNSWNFIYYIVILFIEVIYLKITYLFINRTNYINRTNTIMNISMKKYKDY